MLTFLAIAYSAIAVGLAMHVRHESWKAQDEFDVYGIFWVVQNRVLIIQWLLCAGFVWLAVACAVNLGREAKQAASAAARRQ
ncbi:MAG TPA: hypothetical protein VJ867_02505 [Gemmatimonadaceae bacterium]|nr:hypothetical protein [Gemmatimonadaceae bacterium]